MIRQDYCNLAHCSTSLSAHVTLLGLHSRKLDVQVKTLQVVQQDGDSVETYAFATVPEGQNVTAYTPNNVVLGLTGYQIYPFNETYQAALMNQLHVALDDAGIGHTMYYNGTTVGSLHAFVYVTCTNVTPGQHALPLEKTRVAFSR